MSPTFTDWAVQWLREKEIQLWVLDPWARVISGSASENDNDEVSAVLDVLDSVKGRAGVADLIVVTHLGRKEHEEGTEHARGATRLDDWCDSRWNLTRVGDDRFLRADGRDVEFPERLLRFDPATHRLSLGDGSRSDAKEAKKADAETLRITAAVEEVKRVLRDSPGLGTRDLRAAVRGRDNIVDAAVARLIARERVRTEKVGTRTSHYLVERQPELGLGS